MANDPRTILTAFLQEVQPVSAAYKFSTVSYLGRKGPEGVIRVLKMSVRFQAVTLPSDKLAFASDTVVAGTIHFADGLEDFLSNLLTGEVVDTHVGMFQFTPSLQQMHTFTAYEESASANGTRFVTATIFGIGDLTIPQPSTDWALRAHVVPYNGISDLSADYGFGETGSSPTIVLEAYPVGYMDAGSKVEDEQAVVGVRLAKGLDTDKVTVGVKIISDDGATVRRERLLGTSMEWKAAVDNEEVLSGHARLTVPQNALLHCYLVYDGVPWHSYWVHDLRVIPNSLRLVLESFDDGLERIKKGLAPVSITRRDQDVSEAFEQSCCALLWMLGFSVFRLDRRSASNAVDIVARSNQGHLLLVECTTGPFKADKRANLIKRTAEVRATLARSWHKWVRVIPVMATSEPREIIAQSLPDMRREGLVGCAYDDLVELLDGRTRFPQNSDALFQELEALLRE